MKFYKLSYVNFNQNNIILLCDLTCLLLLFECFVIIIVCILIKSSSLLLEYYKVLYLATTCHVIY